MRRRSGRRAWTALPLVIVALAGCGDTQSTGDSDEPNAAKAPTTVATASPERTAHASAQERSPVKRRDKSGSSSAAAAALEELPVKGRAPKTGYSREQYGNGWLSVKGCATRDRMLERDLTTKRFL